jgi:hypothetical protein
MWRSWKVIMTDKSYLMLTDDIDGGASASGLSLSYQVYLNIGFDTFGKTKRDIISEHWFRYSASVRFLESTAVVHYCQYAQSVHWLR